VCCNETHVSDNPIVIVLSVTYVMVIRPLWRLTHRVLAPLALAGLVVFYRWSTGAPMRPSRRTAARRVTRLVRATGQNMLTVLALGMLVAPVATLVVALAVALGLTGAVVIVRRRKIRQAGPRRVRVTVGSPVSAQPVHRPVPAITTATGPTWTEHQLRSLTRS
jgi:hypothetical protein